MRLGTYADGVAQPVSHRFGGGVRGGGLGPVDLRVVGGADGVRVWIDGVQVLAADDIGIAGEVGLFAHDGQVLLDDLQIRRP